jgi:hypothetical protein
VKAPSAESARGGLELATLGRSYYLMSLTPTQCRDHAMHCHRMTVSAPQTLAIEFERLAQIWAQIADDLQRPQATSESSPEGQAAVLMRA